MGLSNNAYVDLLAERDRLAAENAELREKLQTSERQRNEGACYFDELISKRDRANRNIVSRNEQLWRCVGTAIRLKNKYHTDLAAANATLDRMREVVPEGALCYCYECEAFVVGSNIRRSYNKRCPHCEAEDLTAFAYELQSILYPPETTNDDR